MNRIIITSTAALALIAAAGSANAVPGITLNGPALDGQSIQAPAPLIGGAPIASEVAALTVNGPALDGQQFDGGQRLIGGVAAE